MMREAAADLGPERLAVARAEEDGIAAVLEQALARAHVGGEVRPCATRLVTHAYIGLLACCVWDRPTPTARRSSPR